MRKSYYPLQKTPHTLFCEKEALAKLQDYLVIHPDPIIWMWGEKGLGKSIIAEQFCQRNKRALYISVTSKTGAIINTAQSLIEQIHIQKSELFYNRPQEKSLFQTLHTLFSHCPDSLLVLDHLDRLSLDEIKSILLDIDRVPMPFILINRNPCPLNLFKQRASKLLEWQAVSLSSEEINQIISHNNVDTSCVSILLSASKGNALKLRQMIAKLSGDEIPRRGLQKKEFIKCMAAIVSCGGFLDVHLFCQTFNIMPSLLKTLEQLGLIRYTKEGCYPHDALIEMVEENGWYLNIQDSCKYWNLQILHTPYNTWCCRSLVLLASELIDCSPYKKALSTCLETLSKRENVNFLIDLVSLFQKEGWEELLLRSTDYLIDHEEYILAGKILNRLQNSKSSTIKKYALKNEVRRLVWTGKFSEGIGLYKQHLQKCSAPKIAIPLRNHIAIAHFFLGDWETAWNLFHKNIDYKGKIDIHELGIAQTLVGVIMTYRRENVAKTKKALERSLRIFETTHSYHWIIVSLNEVAHFSYGLKQWHQALYYLHKAEEIARALQNRTFLLFTLSYIAMTKVRLYDSHTQEIFALMLELEELLITSSDGSENWAIPWALIGLSKIYAHRSSPDKIKPIIDILLPLTSGYKQYHIYTLSICGHYAALKSDLRGAKSYFEEAIALSCSLMNEFAIDEIRQDLLRYPDLEVQIPESLERVS